MVVGERAEPAHRGLREIGEVDRFGLDLEAAGPDAAQVEDVGDQAFQPLGLVEIVSSSSRRSSGSRRERAPAASTPRP